MTDNAKVPVPQFTTAEYSNQSAAATCKVCGRALGSTHYRVNGVPTCTECAGQIQARLPEDSHAAFVRGISFGIGGAVLGLILYVLFAIATGLVIGFVSLAVGYIVGKAIVMGSKGRGGRRYQVAAVLLTYMAVSLAAVPIAISQHLKQRQAQEQSQTGDHAAASVPRVGLAKALGELTVLGLASPFLDLANPMHGLIGLVILFVGLRIAWRITGQNPVNIVGPLTAAAPTAPG
ncbi:MAG TPA: hypothetical protein VK700_04410 [Steroidobacteraceae bacterium]|jgi:hypothetical protein|nr:hypothetical protein [Steroidobacteraceae bacterium]